MGNMKKSIDRNSSLNSFDIICDTSISNNNIKSFPSEDDIDNDYIDLLDVKIHKEKEENLISIENHEYQHENYYDTKINFVNDMLETLKKDKHKNKKYIRSLERHKDKILES